MSMAPSLEALRQTMIIFRNEWVNQRWPVPAELLKYLERGELAADQASRPPAIETFKPDPVEWANDQLLKTAEGRKARQLGVVAGCWQVMKDNPGKVLSMAIVDEEAAARDGVDNMHLRPDLAGAWDGMRARERRAQAWFDARVNG